MGRKLVKIDEEFVVFDKLFNVCVYELIEYVYYFFVKEILKFGLFLLKYFDEMMKMMMEVNLVNSFVL